MFGVAGNSSRHRPFLVLRAVFFLFISFRKNQTVEFWKKDSRGWRVKKIVITIISTI